MILKIEILINNDILSIYIYIKDELKNILRNKYINYKTVLFLE